MTSLLHRYEKILTQKRSMSGSDLRDLVDDRHSRKLLRSGRSYLRKWGASAPYATVSTGLNMS